MSRGLSCMMKSWVVRSVSPGLVVVSLLTACAASEEQVKKSAGYYQEGLANLTTDRQRAFVSFQKAIQLNPQNKDAHYGLGHIYAQQGRFADAEAEFRQVLLIDPEHSETLTYLGQVQASQGRWDEAIQSYKKALANPLYATPDLARFHLGRALVHQGDMKAAAAAFEDALQVNPPSIPPARVNLELAQAYYKMGHEQKAKDALVRVSSLDKGGEYGQAAEQLLQRMK
ncbi:MAG: tetratricopeptide repeat protein [Nitrospiraceae bacterium]